MLSLKTKILGAQAATVILTVLLLGSLSYFWMIRSMTALQQEELQYLATSVTAEFGHYLHELEDVLQRIETRDYHRKKGDLPLAKYFSQFMDDFPVLAYLDKQGREQMRLVRGRIATSLHDWGGSDIFREAMRQPNQVLFSRIEPCPELGEPVVWILQARVQYFGDEFLGTVAGAVPLSAIAPIFAKATVGRSGFVCAVDTAGNLVEHRDRPRPLRLVEASGTATRELLASASRAKNGFARATLLGQDSFVAYAPVNRIGWSVLAIRPYAEFMVAPNQLKILSLVACLAILGAGLLLSYLFTRRLTGNIRRLIRHTGFVSEGDLTQRLETAAGEQGDELDRLARSVNYMTERLERANTARESLNQILQSIIDPLVVTDAEWRIIRVNQSAVTLFGHAESELLGRPLVDLFNRQEPLMAEGEFARLLEAGPIRNIETRILTREGRLVPVLLSCSLTGSPDREPVGMVGIIKDISERKHTAEERLRALADAEAARDKIDAILRSVADGLIVTDLDTRIVLMNRAAEKLLGVRFEDIVRQPAPEAFGELRLAALLPVLADGARGEDPVDLEIRDPQGRKTRIVQTQTSHVLNREGLATGWITSLRDVTQDRQIDQMKNEFISTAAHELRTPLTAVLGYAEFLLNPHEFGGFTPEQQKEFAAEIYDKAEILARIVGELLDISRVESGRPLVLDRQPCELDEVIARVARHFQRHHPDYRIELATPQGPPSEVTADEGKLVQVMENLIGNAIKYSDAGSSIRVGLETDGGSFRVSVEDQGIGMTPDEVQRVFDKFYRADASDTAIGGLGLGMSIVRNIVEAHGGEIRIASQPGEGTRVDFFLPAAGPGEALEPLKTVHRG